MIDTADYADTQMLEADDRCSVVGGTGADMDGAWKPIVDHGLDPKTDRANSGCGLS